jgi:hypothetical protein
MFLVYFPIEANQSMVQKRNEKGRNRKLNFSFQSSMSGENKTQDRLRMARA